MVFSATGTVQKTWPVGRRRFSSQRLQHPLFLDALQAPLQKIELQRLLADFAFQLGDPTLGPTLLPLPGNTLPGPWRNSRRQRCSTLAFTSNARATSPMETPCSSRRTAASLNSLVNILLDNPMTQFSFEWILSLNRLCHKWGQLQTQLGRLTAKC